MTLHYPLCVDLDGTLIRCDSLFETFLKALKSTPVKAITSLRHLVQGKAAVKAALTQLVDIDVTSLPYNKKVLSYIESQHPDTEVVLVTGANQRIAERVADHLGVFDSVLASSSTINLTGATKKKVLEDKYGKGQFDYIGNEVADIPVWSSSHQAIVVTSNERFTKSVVNEFPRAKLLVDNAPSIFTWLKFARTHQWAKNLLIFIPLILDHRFFELNNLLTVVLSFLAFSLLASTTYMANDMLDLESDRQNSTKSKRALAAGLLQIEHVLLVMFGCSVMVFLLCLFLPGVFTLLLLAYLVLTVLYSFSLKKMMMMDVCVLALLHTMRLIGGTLTIQAQWSFWLLAFSMFFFLSLAIAKRVSELENVKKENKQNPASRGYRTTDIPVLNSTGIAAGYISVLVIALYINSEKVAQIYAYPEILWCICPPLLYWIGRLWLITSRGEMHEDPIIFALKDLTSVIVLGVVGLVFAAAVLA